MPRRERERETQRLRDSEPQPPFGPSVGSFCHPCITTTYLSYRFPISETSATALCGTAGKCRGYQPEIPSYTISPTFYDRWFQTDNLFILLPPFGMMITIGPNSSKGWLINQPLVIVSLLGWNSKVSINYVIDDIKTTVSEWLSTWGVSAMSYRNHFIWGCTKHLCHTYSYFQGNINKQQPFLSIHRLLSRPCDGPWRSTVRRHALPWPVTSPPKSSSPSSHLEPFWDWFGTEKICRTLHFFWRENHGKPLWNVEKNVGNGIWWS